ncbi:hypothetical protein COO60DRAFT_857577 [Scenedesmus sp. NREL 46B-D3]|nr:hypothetical protein COO60DRAFT_857577 [Scenedesmus sp. NREL 46B-D3]
MLQAAQHVSQLSSMCCVKPASLFSCIGRLQHSNLMQAPSNIRTKTLCCWQLHKHPGRHSIHATDRPCSSKLSTAGCTVLGVGCSSSSASAAGMTSSARCCTCPATGNCSNVCTVLSTVAPASNCTTGSLQSSFMQQPISHGCACLRSTNSCRSRYTKFCTPPVQQAACIASRLHPDPFASCFTLVQVTVLCRSPCTAAASNCCAPGRLHRALTAYQQPTEAACCSSRGSRRQVGPELCCVSSAGCGS